MSGGGAVALGSSITLNNTGLVAGGTIASGTITALTTTTATLPTATVTTLNAPSGVLATQNGMAGIARAWVNWLGSSGGVNGSFNVSSVTRVSTGVYIINLTTAVPNTNYVRIANATVNLAGTSGLGIVLDWNGSATASPTTSSYYVAFYNLNGLAVADPLLGYSVIFSV